MSAQIPVEPEVMAVEEALRTGEDQCYVIVTEDWVREAWASEFLELDPDPESPDQLALTHAHGRILDVGAGAGRHSLALQALGRDVTSLDHSPGFVALMRGRGVQRPVCGDIRTWSDTPFDTILLLCNGAGMVGSVSALVALLKHLHTLVTSTGQLLIDGAETYTMEGLAPPELGGDKTATSFEGELITQRHYGEHISAPAPWLFPDLALLRLAAERTGWKTTVLSQQDEAWLVRLEP